MGNLFDGQSDFNDQFKILNYEFETFTKFPQDITNTSFKFTPSLELEIPGRGINTNINLT